MKDHDEIVRLLTAILGIVIVIACIALAMGVVYLIWLTSQIIHH